MKRWERNEDRIIRRVDTGQGARPAAPSSKTAQSVLGRAAFSQLFRESK